MDDLKRKYLGLIAGAPDEAGLEDLRVAALGKKGEISGLMKSLGGMSTEERQSAGPALNALKDEINSALVAKKSALGDAPYSVLQHLVLNPIIMHIPENSDW